MRFAKISRVKAKLVGAIRRAIANEKAGVADADGSQRTGGQWRGKIWISSDFNDYDAALESLFYDAPLMKS